MEIEGRADGDQDRRLERLPELGHPPFLLGRTKADPYDVRPGRVDA